jgi:L,D-peptidoglycan transpeptidase YkuD (ErfK/YbiS/YcfS/YnhG family)
VLNGRFRRSLRPATGVRRRSFLFIRLVAAFGGSLAEIRRRSARLAGRVATFGAGFAGARRRSYLLGGLVVTLGAGFAVSGWTGAEPPLELATIDAARRSSLKAVRALREPTPATARLLDRLIADAEVITADERTAPSWERSPGRVEAAWTRPLLTARKSLVDVHSRRRTWETRWTSLRDSLAADVRRAQLEADEAGVSRREISAAKQAALKWDLAQRYAASGAHERAVVAAEQAREFTEIVRSGFVALHARYRDPRQLRRWRALADETIAYSRASGETVFLVDKLKRKLYVYSAGKRIATYNAELGVKGLRQKLHSGDQATPEGRYRVTQVRGTGRTQYYKALLLDYPNPEDRARYAFGRRSGEVPRRAGIGSLIEIHGDGGQGRDWTDGCVALRNDDMDRLFARAQTGMTVTIVGTF